MIVSRRLSVLLLVSFSSFSTALLAQSASTVHSLVTGRIDDSQRVTLEGNTRPEARRPGYDRGPVAEDFAMSHMWLLLKRSPEQEATLVKRIDAMHDPKSPLFHQWMTPKEFAGFGLSDSDTGKISNWLTEHGFKVDALLPNRMVIEFSGTAGMVREAFHTEIHSLNVHGELHFGNVSDPQIPAALAPAVAGVVSMHNFKPHGDHVAVDKHSIDRNGHVVTRESSANPPEEKGPHSDYTFVSGSLTYTSLVPADAQTIYNVTPIYAAGFTGEDQTIVVLEDSDDYSDADFARYRSKFGLQTAYPSGNLVTVHPSGSASCKAPGAVAGVTAEVELDMEMATAVAPSATVEIASCADTTNFGGLIAVQNLINGSNYPPVMSLSYGECEAVSGATQNAAFSSTFQQAAAEGVSIFVSSGDNAAAGCENNLFVKGQNSALHGRNISGWGETAYNVSVGGTDFQDTSLGESATYWNTTNASNYGSAKSYIPEIPWDGSCAGYSTWKATGGTSALAYCNTTAGEAFLSVSGGGGGVSACYSGAPAQTGVGTSGTCKGLAKPSWQSGVFGIPADGKRDVPDVSLFAASGHWLHYWTICFSDATDTADGGASCAGEPSTWTGIGGTSASSPVMAAIQTLIDQKYGYQGNPNYVLYGLASVEYGTSGSSTCNSNGSTAPASNCVFYDLTYGDNLVNCKGTVDCFLPQGQTNGTLSTSDTSSVDVYNTAVGYDLASGIGSVNAANLFTKWASVGTGQKLGTTISFTVSANPVPVGTPLIVTATLTLESGSSPTGNVDYYLDGGAATGMTCSGKTSPLTCMASIPTTGLSGSHTLRVSYAGDSTYYPSTSPTESFSTYVPQPPPPAVASSVVVTDVYDADSTNSQGQSVGLPRNFLQASDGNFYGTTYAPNQTQGGNILKFAAGTFIPSVLHVFNLATEGDDLASLTQGPNGLLYGLSFLPNNGGALFYSISLSGTFTTIAHLSASTIPGATVPMTLGSDGNFYAVSNQGGALGYGAVVRITPGGVATGLATFTNQDGPSASVVETTPGTFYGVAYSAGANGDGYIYKMVLAGDAATVSDVYDFNGTNGTSPQNPLIEGANGNLYGVTPGGGANSQNETYGTIFEVTPAGILTTLADFSGGTGLLSYPTAFIQGSDGNFYGDDLESNNNAPNYQSTIFAMNPSGTLTIPSNPDGSEQNNVVDAFSPMLQASDGTVLQSTGEGGKGNSGDLVKMTFTPAQKGPVQLVASGTPKTGQSFTLTYTLPVAYSTSAQQCYAYESAAGAGNFTGKLAGALGSTGYSGSVTVTPASAGSYTYSVTCEGRKSATAKVTVAQGPRQATNTVVAVTPSPVVVGQQFTITATVTAGTSPVNTKDLITVVIQQGTTTLATYQSAPNSSGQFVITVGSTVISKAGAYTVSASFAGDSTVYAPSSEEIGFNAGVVKSATTTTLTANQNPVMALQLITLTASVSGNNGVATGSVSLTLDGTTLATGQLSGGKVSFNVSSPDAGTVPLVAVYSGDASNLGSSSAIYNVVITKANTTVTASPSLACVDSGHTVTLSAQVHGSGATGTLTYSDLGFTIGSGNITVSTPTLSTDPNFILSTNGVGAGLYTLTAAYSGDVNNNASSTSFPLLVMPNAPVTITASPNPVPSGGTVTFTAMIGCSGPIPTGTVDFDFGSIVLQKAVPLVNGMATYKVSTSGFPASGANGYPITAVYSGDAHYPAGSGSVTIVLQ